MRQPRPVHVSTNLAILSFALSASGCAEDRFSVTVCAVDRAGQPVQDATVEVEGRARRAGKDGCVVLRRLEHPVLAVLRGPGMLAEPALIGRGDVDAPLTVPLHDADAHVAMHFAGDVMLGRRYDQPDTGAPLLESGDGGASAEALVQHVAGAFSLADLASLNLETVVGELADEDAYPAKRWLLLTRPEHLDGVLALGADIVGLANNHQRDWLDEGVASTIAALDAREILHVGAGLDAEQAEAPVRGEVGGLSVGMLAWTSVDGDYVNDQYPLDEEEAPADLAPEEAWMWEARSWGEESLGVPVASRRLGSAWQALLDAEPSLNEQGRAALWASAEAVYPELQDWVARRGHGGAALWTDQSPAAITALAARVDVMVVQLHMGFQFAPAGGEAVREAARAAVDAGADLVVCHHPHVLQGVEWYKGKLIAYSLGNFVFDQNFLSTWPSGFLRTIWTHDGALVEARFVPGLLDAYQPVLVTDALAQDVLRTVWDRSQILGEARRGDDLAVRTVAEDLDPNVTLPGMVLEHGTGRITAGAGDLSRRELVLPASGALALPRDGLVRLALSEPPPADVEVGRALFGLGRFEDDDVDDVEEVPGWTWDAPDIDVTDRDASEGRFSLELVRQPVDQSHVSARTLARIPLQAHRLYADADGAEPLDGAARYSLRLQAWIAGEPDRASLRLLLYHFDDLDPTVAPTSAILQDLDLHLSLSEGGWQEVLVEVPSDALEPIDGRAPNAALLYVRLDPPAERSTVLRVDEVELIEWRAADAQPAGFGALDLVRSVDGEERPLWVDVWPW